MQEIIIFSLLGFTFLFYGINVWAQTMPVATTGDPNEQAFNPRSHANLGNDIARDNATALKWVRNGNGMASRDTSF
jgi:hypothetical protein